MEMPELVADEASKEEMEKLTEEGKEKEKGHVEGRGDGGDDDGEGSGGDFPVIEEDLPCLADMMWKEVRGVRIQRPTVKTAKTVWPPSWCRWCPPGWTLAQTWWQVGGGAGSREHATNSDIRYYYEKKRCLRSIMRRK